MVAPVANIGPGVLGFGALPVDTLARDAIGVVPVGGAGVYKLGDHVGAKARNRRAKGFPVLKDIAPVALVIKNPGALVVFHFDGKAIPRPRWVPVAPAKALWRSLMSVTARLNNRVVEIVIYCLLADLQHCIK